MGIADDIRDVYSEAKANGCDAKIMRQIVRNGWSSRSAHKWARCGIVVA